MQVLSLFWNSAASFWHRQMEMPKIEFSFMHVEKVHCSGYELEIFARSRDVGFLH
jgi:hypothetical protein